MWYASLACDWTRCTDHEVHDGRCGQSHRQSAPSLPTNGGLGNVIAAKTETGQTPGLVGYFGVVRWVMLVMLMMLGR